ncbi:MAG TPA: flagellar basal body rod protein FlgC [Stellaceae bacterium]|nr:flagellar basal body rod protein FlgC [Stellaceae bacterium]
MDLNTAMQLAAGGLSAQGTRLKVIAENLANADSTAQTPGGDPYRRKVVSFRAVLDRSLGATGVKVGPVLQAQGAFERRFDPANPAAGADGYVLLPNVNPLIEITDMREAQQSYQANLNVIDAAKQMISHTLDLMRS